MTGKIEQWRWDSMILSLQSCDIEVYSKWCPRVEKDPKVLT